VDEIKSGVI